MYLSRTLEDTKVNTDRGGRAHYFDMYLSHTLRDNDSEAKFVSSIRYVDDDE